jgi:hypothetical protein
MTAPMITGILVGVFDIFQLYLELDYIAADERRGSNVARRRLPGSSTRLRSGAELKDSPEGLTGCARRTAGLCVRLMRLPVSSPESYSSTSKRSSRCTLAGYHFLPRNVVQRLFR